MAGNACSLIGISTSGKGGKVSEILPRFKASSFTVQERQNTRFRCKNCGTSLAGVSHSAIKHKNECPFCHAKDCVVTVQMAREVSNNNKYEYNKVLSYLKENPNSTLKELSSLFNIPYQNLYIHAKNHNWNINKRTYRKNNA